MLISIEITMNTLQSGWHCLHGKAHYIQLAEFLEHKIKAGAFEHSALPSYRKLEKLFGLSKSTIMRAFDLLSSRGLVVKKGNRLVPVFTKKEQICASPWTQYLSKQNKPTNRYVLNTLVDKDFDFAPHYENAIKAVCHAKRPAQHTSKCAPELFPYLSEILNERHIEADVSNILVLPSLRTAFYLINAVLFASASSVFIPETSAFSEYLPGGQSKHGWIRCDDEGLIPADLESKARHTKGNLLYIEPVNSQLRAKTLSSERRAEIEEICKRNNVYIVEGDYQRELIFDTAPLPLKAGDSTGRLYLSHLLYEFYPQGHISFLTGPAYLINHFYNVYKQITRSASYFRQLVLSELLESAVYAIYKTNYLERLEDRFEAVYKLMDELLKDLAVWNKPKGGLFIVVSFKVPLCRIRIPSGLCNWFPLGGQNRREDSIALSVVSAPLSLLTVFFYELASEICRAQHEKP